MKPKLLLLTLLVTAATLAAKADPAFSSGGRYHIVCQQFAQGCVTDGQTAQQPTPLYYLTQATTANETYWTVSEVNTGEYAIRNASTGAYITYDGVREDIAQNGQLRRYISMTDEMNGQYSLWTFVLQSEGVYVIRNVGQSDHVWDVRVDSYCVGTYSKTSAFNINQLFSIYDAQGNLVTEQPVTPVTTEGLDVSSWLDATTESPDAWTHEGTSWTDPGFGNYRNGDASVVSPFLERWNDTNYGPLQDGSIAQTLSHLPAGAYTLHADIIAVRQPSSNGWWGRQDEETGRGVYLFAANQTTEAGTRNERPEHYSVSFTVGTSGSVTLGVRISNTNANWVAVDNFRLAYGGTEEELLEGERAKVRAELAGYYSDSEIEQLVSDCGDSFEELELLRKSVANLPAIDPIAMALQNLTIDGRSLAWAESIDLYLHSLPEEHINDEYLATINYNAREGCSNLSINNREVQPGTQYRFSTIRPGNTYTLSATLADGTTVTKRMTFTSLPVVKIYGTFNNVYSQGYIQVLEPTATAPADLLNMKAKWRGGITNSNGKNKRNYHVKLKDENGDKLERKFFGLRNDNSWILEACQVDMSRIRNRVLTDLWNDYSTPPYYIAQEKKAKTGTRGEFVELILNDEYRGIYCMTENLDRKQMKLKKIDEETQTTHGQLWKSKDWSYAVLMGTRPDPHSGSSGYSPRDYLSTTNSGSDMWDRYQVKYPDFEDYGYETDWQVLYDAVNFVCTANDPTFSHYAEQYFDLPLIIDYYILMETTLATDNHGKNLFFAVYDKQVDQKITLGVWDMDATCGQRWSDAYYHSTLMQPEQDYATFIDYNEHGDYNLFKRLRDTDASDFNMQTRLRYRELRDSYLATESILQRFRDYFEHFRLAGADQREYDKWSYDSDVSGHELDFDTEMTYITDWFTRRMNYLDTQRFDIGSLPPTTIITPQQRMAGQSQPVYSIGGVKVGTTDQIDRLPAGVYVIGGKKTVVGR